MPKLDIKECVSDDAFRSFSGLVVIPIKNRHPVLIFKDIGAPFYYEILSGPFSGALYNYQVYWDGKFYDHALPDCIQKQYGSYFQQLIENSIETRLEAENFPAQCVELPISFLANAKINLAGKQSDIKKTLRFLGFFAETRGKKKKPDEEKRVRNKYIVKIYNDLDHPTRLPIKDIQKELTQYLHKICPDKADKLAVSDSQIRRIIKFSLSIKKLA